MKTSFFKRKPDLNSATLEYFEAGGSFFSWLCVAQAYYVAQDYENAIKYYEKSAELDQQVEEWKVFYH